MSAPAPAPAPAGRVAVRLPADVLARYDRIIDALREDAAITAEIYLDKRRLVAAFLEVD